MRWQAWKRGARLTLRGTGILLLVLGATVLLLWLRLELNRAPKPEEILAKANGWSSRGKDVRKFVRERLQHDGTPLLTLLADDDPRRHQAAAALSPGTFVSVDGASLDRIIRLLTTVSPEHQESIVRCLSGQIRGGASRLADLLRSPEPLPASLRAMMLHRLRFDPRDSDAYCLLMPTVLDPTAAWQNRATAIDLLGRNPQANAVAELEEFATLAPDVLKRSLRLAVSRLRDAPDIERLTEDLNAASDLGDPSLGAVLETIASLGDAAQPMGPELVRLIQPNTVYSGPRAAIALGRIGYREAIPVLRSVGLETDDWKLTAAAAEALGLLRATEAEGDLRRLAATAPHSIVAAVSHQAAEAIQGRYSYPVTYRPLDTQTDRILNARLIERRTHLPLQSPPTAWEAFQHKHLAPTWESIRVFAIRLLSPTVNDGEWTSGIGQVLSVNFEFMPSHRSSFAGGTLLGNDDWHSGIAVVHVPQRGPARFFTVPGVSSFIRWGDDILIAPSDHAIWGHDLLWRATTTPKGQVVVEPYKRVQFKRWSRESDGSLLFDGTRRLSRDGKLIQLVPDR